MSWWEALMWGLFGGLAVEGLDFCKFTRLKHSDRKKMKLTRGDILLVGAGVVVRTALGGGVATAMALDGQVVGAMAGIGIGAAAPLILVQLGQAVVGPAPAAGGPNEPNVLGNDARLQAPTPALDTGNTASDGTPSSAQGGAL